MNCSYVEGGNVTQQSPLKEEKSHEVDWHDLGNGVCVVGIRYGTCSTYGRGIPASIQSHTAMECL